MSAQRILRPGQNCWRIRKAEKVAFLIDADNYFPALHDALCHAQQDIFILSWDIFSELRLGALQGDERTLSNLLNDQLTAHQGLNAHILNWDYAMLFAMSREWLPTYKLGWLSHPRLQFSMDKYHPVSASHHQKIAIIDYQLAFAGGLDITRGRWDTSEHRSEDPRRQQIDGSTGRPYHDVQVAVTGDAAVALHDLARERWRRATDSAVAKPSISGEPYWPEGLRVDLENVDVAIIRTLPAHEDYEDVREVEQLYIDSIAAARDFIYIENQYFTSPTIAEALKQRLAEDDGPEIIINLPLATEGWLAQNSMDVIRVKLFQQLREVDHQQRLAIYYAGSEDEQSNPINLHAKVTVIDDRFMRIGSSNLNNRSMGLDTECDIAIEGRPDDAKIGEGVARFKARLMAEHLNTDVDSVLAAVKQHGSHIQAIESLRGKGPRTLKPLEDALPDYRETLLTESELVDPEQPILVDRMVENWVPTEDTEKPRRGIAFWLTLIAALIGLAVAWRYTPLQQWLDVERISALIETVNELPYSPVILIGAFILAGLAMVPVTLLVIAMVIVFGPWLGFLYAMIGAITSSLAGYGLGHFLGRDTLQSLSGGQLHKISTRLAKRGVLTIVVLRIVPVAPFTVINLVAGASHIRFTDFLLGNLVGLLPGIVAISILANSIADTFMNPSLTNMVVLGLIALMIYSLGWMLSRVLLRNQEQ